MVAALGPVMLRLTGEMADGTNTWMVGPRTMETHIVKTINDAAQAAGKPAAMIVGNFPVVLTNDVDNAKSKLSEMLSVYGELPSYRAMLDREGYERPEDAALVGDEKTIRASLDRLRDAGVTDFGAAIMNVEDGGFDRTFEFLASLN